MTNFSQPQKQRKILIEIGNSITHGLGAILAAIGSVLLILQAIHANSLLKLTTFAIYGTILTLFYLASALFHSLIFTQAKHIFQILDHAMIYLLIAGSYTPYCLIAIQNWQGWALLILIWIIALAGVIYKAIQLNQKSKLSTVIYVIMGWLCLVALKPLYQALGPIGFSLLLAGGVTFTTGAIIYSLSSSYAHLIWHIFVLMGTALVYFSIFFFI